jgi:hypothetical protein
MSWLDRTTYCVETDTNYTVAPTTKGPKAPLPWKKKLLIVGLLCLEIPFGVAFFPLAAVLVLTGILAPLGMMSFKAATMPISLAMKYKDTTHSGGGLNIQQEEPQ